MHDIIIRFPDEETADTFCGQLSDGFGSNYCDFNFRRHKEGTDGSAPDHYELVTSSAPEGTKVFFVDAIYID